MSSERLDFILRIVDKMTAPLRSANRGLQGVDKSLQQVGKSKAFDNVARGARRAGSSMRKAAQDAEKMDKSLQRSANMSMASGAARRVGSGMLGAVVAPVKEFKDFDHAMSRVKALTGDFTDDQRKLALQLGETTRYTNVEAATAMGNLAMRGFTAQEQMQSLGHVLALDAAGGMNDLGESAAIAGRVLKGFNLPAVEMSRVANVLTATFTASGTSLQGLGETMNYVAPVAAKAGVSLEEAAKMAGMLGDAGIEGSRAGTTLRLMIANLAGASPAAADELKRLGIKTKDAAGNLLPMSKVLSEVGDKMSAMGSGDAVESAAKIFGLRGVPGGLQIADQLAKAGLSSQRLDDSLRDLNDRALRTAATMDDDLHGDLVRLESAFSGLKTEIGSGFNEELRKGAQLLSNEVLPSMTEFVKEHKELSKWVGGGLAIGGAFATATAGIIDFVANIALMKIAFGGAGLGMLLKPVFALGRGLAWLWALGGKIGAAVEIVWSQLAIGPAIMTALTASITGVAVTFATFGAAITGTVAVVLSQWESVRDLFANAPQWFHEIGASIVEGLIGGWRAVFGTWESEIVNSMTGITQTIESIMGIHSPSKVMAGIGENMAAGLSQGFNGTGGGAASIAPSVPQIAGAGGGAGAMGGGRTVVFRPEVHVIVGSGDVDGGAVGESVVDSLRAFFDEATASLGA